MIPNDKDMAKLEKLAPGIGEMFARRKAGKCPKCAADMAGATFTDDASRAEYKITGYCQRCQDELFSEGE